MSNFTAISRKRGEEVSYFGNIAQHILRLTANFRSYSVSHVKREGNRVAHNLAKTSGDYADMRV